MALRPGNPGTCCSSACGLGEPQASYHDYAALMQLIRNLLVSDGKSITVTCGTTFDNRANLVGNLSVTIVKQYVATQLGRQELNAELIDDGAGALWARRLFDLCTSQTQSGSLQCNGSSSPSNRRPKLAMKKIELKKQDFIVAGLGRDERGYGLDDLSRRLSPRMTGRRTPWWSKSTGAVGAGIHLIWLKRSTDFDR